VPPTPTTDTGLLFDTGPVFCAECESAAELAGESGGLPSFDCGCAVGSAGSSVAGSPFSLYVS